MHHAALVRTRQDAIPVFLEKRYCCMMGNVPPCRFFLRGLCRYGIRCRFRHDLSENFELPFRHRETVQIAASATENSQVGI